MGAVTVLCVLKTGGIYDDGHVARLRQQAREHAPGAPFVCLTDDPRVPADVARRLEHGWPGWWSKMEAYKVPGPCLYLDLDVTVCGPLGPLLDAASSHELVVCASFWVPGEEHKINSSVVGWCADVSPLYREFAKAPVAHMDVYRTREHWGDQAFVADHAERWHAWQDVCAGMVLSYKRDVLVGKSTRDMRVCVHHGRPKPWEVPAPRPWRAPAGDGGVAKGGEPGTAVAAPRAS